MDDSAWRLTVEFATSSDATALARQLREDAEIDTIGGSWTETSKTIYAYGPTPEHVERVAAVVTRELHHLGLAPARSPSTPGWHQKPGGVPKRPTRAQAADWLSALISSIDLTF